MQRQALETVMGAVVLVVAALFVVFAYGRSSLPSVGGYEVNARFSRVNGLEIGHDVRMSGVKVGNVTNIELDLGTYFANVTLSVREDLKLPTDTIASVTSDGLLGETYLELEPGIELEDFIEPGGRINDTKPPFSIFTLVNQFLAGTESNEDDSTF